MPVIRLQCKYCEAPLDLNKAKCPSCNSWNSDDPDLDESKLLADVVSAGNDRIMTGFVDEIWGGGIVRTSTTLFGGMPGAGKSTILLQILDAVFQFTKVEGLYVATEEVLPEIKMRADRLGIRHQHGIRMVPAMGGVNVPAIMERRKPSIIVVDSLQGLVGENDSAAVQFLTNMKKWSGLLSAPTIVISHVTKDGNYAGLMTYQHSVDTLLLMHPDESDGTRKLSVKKNRFGRAFISMFFHMTEVGLKPVTDDVEEDEDDDEFDSEDDLGEVDEHEFDNMTAEELDEMERKLKAG